MLENATRICEANFGILHQYRNGAFHVAAMVGVPPILAKALVDRGVYVPPAGIPLDRLLKTRSTIHILDQTQEKVQPPSATLAGARSHLSVPMIKEGEILGAFTIYRTEVRPFTDKQIALVQNFAAQAVIAIENTRLLNELRQSLEQQTTTAEILEVISKSLSDTQPVFESIVRSGVTLFSDAAVSVALVDDGMVKAAAVAHRDPGSAEAWRSVFPFPLTPEYMHSKAILDHKMLDIPDVEHAPADLAVGAKNFLRSGYRAVTIVPLMRDGQAIGALSVVRVAPGPLSDKQLATLETYANQAIIAIENTRLLNELRESLQQQTATSEVLGVISSSPGELQPVFDAMLANATRICEASFGNMLLYNGEAFRHVALHNAPHDWAVTQQRDPVAPRRSARMLYRVTETKQVVHVADIVVENPEEPIAKIAGARSLLIAPMLKENELIGVIAIYRQEVRPFTDKQIALVQNFAAQAVIAVENTRLLNELRESLQQQTATADVLRVISSSPGELTPVFDAIL